MALTFPWDCSINYCWWAFQSQDSHNLLSEMGTKVGDRRRQWIARPLVVQEVWHPGWVCSMYLTAKWFHGKQFLTVKGTFHPCHKLQWALTSPSNLVSSLLAPMCWKNGLMDTLKVDRPVDLSELKYILGLVASQKPRGRKGIIRNIIQGCFFLQQQTVSFWILSLKRGEIWV